MALRQTWSRCQVLAMLCNPKYTGYNVWGRHDKRRGRPTGSARLGPRPSRMSAGWASRSRRLSARTS